MTRCDPNSPRGFLENRPSPYPLPIGWGEGSFFFVMLTQGGAPSSLTLGYYRLAPTGRQFEPSKLG